MANRFIDATLRFRDEFSGEFGRAAKQMSEQEKHLRKVSGAVTKVGRGFTNAGKTLTAGVTAPIVALGASSVKVAADFEAGMSKVQSLCGASADEMEQLAQKAQEMGGKTKFSASESADAFSYMATAGWKTKDMLDGIEGIMYLAGATGEDLATTSDIVTDALTAFGMQASDTNHFVDVLAKTASNANTDVGMMGESFKMVAPVAGALKYSVDDVSLALGLMANSGIKASSAGTALRSFLTNLSKPSKQVKAAMDELGISLTDASGEMKPMRTLMEELRGKFGSLSEAQKAQYAASLAGKTGMSGLLAIVNASESDFDSLTGSISDCTGASKDMYDVANDNLQGQLTILKSTLESIQITIGNKLMPVIKPLVGKLQEWAEKINGLDDRQVEMIVKIAGVAAVLGPALLVIGKVVMTIGKVINVIGTLHKVFSAVSGVMSMTNPVILIVVAVVAALAAIGYVVYKNWDKIKPLFEKVGEALKKFGAWCKDIFFKVKEWFVKTYNNLKEKFTAMLDKVRSSPGILGAVFKTIKGYIDAAKQVFSGIIQFVKGVFSGNWKMAWQGIVKIFGGIWAGLKNYVKTPINAVIGLVNGAIKAINKIQINIPDWVPVVGGKTLGFHLKTIPFLAKGSPYFTGGPALINERGGEIVNLPRGTQIIPHDQSIRQAVVFGQQLEARRLEGRLVQIADVLRTRSALQLPQLSAAAATAKGTATKPETVEKHITVAKIADTVVIREKADADELAEILAKKLEELDDNVA